MNAIRFALSWGAAVVLACVISPPNDMPRFWMWVAGIFCALMAMSIRKGG